MKKTILLLALSLVIFSSCKKKDKWEEVSVNIEIERFDRDMKQFNIDSTDYYINYFYAKYGRFYNLYNERILLIGSYNNKAYTEYFSNKINDYYSHILFKEIEEKFPNLSKEEKILTKAFKIYKYHFPEKSIPRVVSFMGGLNQSIVVTDSILGIGLDKYLGSEQKFYTSAGYYNYQVQNMNPENICGDAMKGWFTTEWEQNSEDNLLSTILYKGKILYMTKLCIPDISDELLMGYTKEQIDWIKDLEPDVWNFLIEEKLLFTTDYKTIRKFTEDGPFTSVFSRESPPRAINWIGYQIISEYMKKKNTTPLELMNITNSQQILRESKYKPKQ